MKKVNVKALLSNLLNLMKDQDPDYHALPVSMWRDRDRVCGVIEGVMLGAGIIEPGTKYDYKQITVENPSLLAPWFPGTKPTIVRKERYHEMIERITKLYISLPERDES